MQRTKKGHILPQGFGQNAVPIFFAALMLAYLCGCVISRGFQSDEIYFLQTLFSNSFHRKITLQFSEIFFTTFLNYFIPLLLLYCIGFIPFALPFLIGIVFFMGMGQGVMSGYIYLFQGWQGVVYFLTLSLPPMLIGGYTLIAAAQNAHALSKENKENFRAGSPPANLHSKLRLYSVRFAFFVLFLVLGALIDALLSRGFLQYFHFS